MMTLLWTVLIVLALLGAAYLWTQAITREAETVVPMPGTRLDLPGGSIHYVEVGSRDAPTLVLIHGLSGTLQHFTYAMVEDLARDHHVIALDRPGCGYSTPFDVTAKGLSAQAEVIGLFLDRLEVQNPVLVGHSLGGALALAMALERPDKTAGMALLCPLTHPVDAIAEVFKPLTISSPRLRNFVAQTLYGPFGKLLRGRNLRLVFAPEPATDDFMTRGGGLLALRPSAFLSSCVDLQASAGSIEAQAARYGTLTVPGAVLNAAGDEVLDPVTQGRPMRQFGLGYEELDNRGHMIPITAPANCADFIRRTAARCRAEGGMRTGT
ncbi:alpha/beta hydrolase [Ruegeria sp. 2205SS24-7]|uniref:alpha/beta fold hydrolase n=1 Tax=Ruegeria discodermiae TaxID=3064389 RepID=UPI0027426569|nr:alpha/beta hydrolase [Ruegeria sp. 2205SS24-7]MDP5218566.1 alpha/beta hydrolase [Ruegeria sp. 2205SS24-7]